MFQVINNSDGSRELIIDYTDEEEHDGVSWFFLEEKGWEALMLPERQEVNDE